MIKQCLLVALACGAAGLFGAGCAATDQNVATHYHQITGLRTDLMANNRLPVQEPVRELVWLNASRVFTDYRNYEYYLEVHYEATQETGFLDIPPGESLSIQADGETLKFQGAGSLNHRKQQEGLVSEDALYRAEPGQLQTIASATNVTVRVIGNNGVVERSFEEKNHERFQEFVANYVTGSGRAPAYRPPNRGYYTPF